MDTAKNYSFPRERIRVLLLENIHPSALTIFEDEHYQVKTMSAALSEAELMEQISDVSILGIRSNTKLTAKVIASAPRLLAIGAFCIGTNQIDISVATSKGIVLFNAPYGNTRSVVELVISEIIALNRHLIDKNTASHAGTWSKSTEGSHEVRGRTLGIVGYGSIGTSLSIIAEALGMQVYYYDVGDKLAYGNTKRCATLTELLNTVDIVTVHVDGRKQNEKLFGAKEFAAMRPGSLFLNLSRGMVVDEIALTKALKSGHLSGAAIDVYESEPKSKNERFTSSLQNLSNVILTPHIASGTEEAQESIGTFVATKLVKFMNSGDTSLSVNLPALEYPKQNESHRLILAHANVPGALAKINTLLAAENINIVSQYLGTKDDVGYVITDINNNYRSATIKKLQALPETIRLRVLY